MFIPYALVRNAAVIPGFQSADVNLNTQLLRIAGGGSIHPKMAHIISQDPQFGFTVLDLATLLDLNSAAFVYKGVPISGDDAIHLYLQKREESAIFDATAAHTKFSIAKGVLYPTGISAAQDGYAVLTGVARALYDGTNDPIVQAVDQTLPAAPSMAPAYTLGPVYINGAEVVGAQSVELANLVNCVVKRWAGETWAKRGHLGKTEPRLTISLGTATPVSTFGLKGTRQSASDTVIYLRKLDSVTNCLAVADATEEHISITIDEGIIHPTRLGGAVGEDELATELSYELLDDGTNAIMVVDTTVAIP